MSKSVQLYTLIHSLTKSEKRYFKIYATRHVKGGGNIYVQVFDFLLKQKKYDYNALKQYVTLNHKVRLTALKTQLGYHVLRSLRMFHSSLTLVVEIRELMDFAEILIAKSHFEFASQYLNKAKKLAESSHRYDLLDEIVSIARQVAKRLGSQKMVAQYVDVSYLESIHYRRENDLKRQFEHLEARMLQLLTQSSIYIRSPLDEMKLESLMQAPALQSNEGQLSFACLRYYHGIWSRYCLVLGAKEKALYHVDQSIRVYESSESFLDDNLIDYMGQLINNLMITSVFKDRERHYASRTKIVSLLDKFYPKRISNTYRKHLELQLTYTGISFLLDMGEYSDALIAVKEAQRKWELESKGTVPELKRMITHYNLVMIYIRHRKFKAALTELNQLIELEALKNQTYLHLAVMMMNVIVHYELSHHMLVESLAISLGRFLKRKKINFEFETAFLKFTKSVLIEPTLIDRDSRFEAFKQQLDLIYQKPMEHNVERYFHCYDWVKDSLERLKQAR